MALAIPSEFVLSVSSTVSSDFGTIIDQTDDGSTYSRDLYQEPNYTIQAKWDLLDIAEYKQLNSFLRDNRTATFSLFVDDEEYHVTMVGFPAQNWKSGNLRALSATFKGRLVT